MAQEFSNLRIDNRRLLVVYCQKEISKQTWIAGGFEELQQAGAARGFHSHFPAFHGSWPSSFFV